jgi:hypothetical protein
VERYQSRRIYTNLSVGKSDYISPFYKSTFTVKKVVGRQRMNYSYPRCMVASLDHRPKGVFDTVHPLKEYSRVHQTSRLRVPHASRLHVYICPKAISRILFPSTSCMTRIHDRMHKHKTFGPSLLHPKHDWLLAATIRQFPNVDCYRLYPPNT